MKIRESIAYVAHRYFRVPYALNVVEFQSPKKPRATFILLHGIGNSLYAWKDVLPRMPKDVRIIGIDLLGFGKSPKPVWARYNARAQARSVGVTVLRLKLAQKPVIVGHSLGALVAVAVAKRYPFAVRQLVLCSPPFYKLAEDSKWQEKALRKMYTAATKQPERLQKLSPLAVKLGLANKALRVDDENLVSYIATMKASILNQTSLDDIETLHMPITIFHGRFDPVVVKKYLVELKKSHANITLKQVFASHEVIGRYVTVLSEYLATIGHKK